jgi:hypothetical protein
LFSQGYSLHAVSSTSEVPDLEAKKRRQNIFREQGLIDLLLIMLNVLKPISERLISGECSPKQLVTGGLISVGKGVISDVLKLLLQFVTGNHGNQILVSDYMLVVLAHVSTDPIAAKIAREMLGNNREVQETKIGIEEIGIFAQRMRDSEMNDMFIQLLQACCSCNGHGIWRNQLVVNKVLYDKYQDVVIIVNVLDKKDGSNVDWQSASSYSLYMPNGDEEMLGSRLVTDGLTSIGLTWTSNSGEFGPKELFSKDVVPIGDIYRYSGVASSKPISERRKNVSNFFISQLYLVAEMCVERNYAVITTMEVLYPYEVLITLLKANYSDSLKGSAARLLMCLYVDRDPQIEIKLPRLTRMWSEISQFASSIILSVESDRKYKFGLLQLIISDHIRLLKNKPYGKQTLYMVQLLHKLLCFNFYGSSEKLMDVIDPLVAALKRDEVEGESFKKDKISKVRKEKSSTQLTILKESGDESREDSCVEKLDVDDSLDELGEPIEKQSIFSKTLIYLESFFHLYIMMFIVFVAVMMALYEYFYNPSLFILDVIEYGITFLFFFEVYTRCICHRIVRHNFSKFFSDPLNLIDIFVVVIDFSIIAFGSLYGDVGQFAKFLRVARLLRLFRILRAFRMINKIVMSGIKSFSGWVEPLRYSSTLDVTLQTMIKMVEVLSTIQRTVEDRNISLLLQGIYDLELEDATSKSYSNLFDGIFDNSRDLKVSCSAYDDIYLDLLMYRNPQLTQITIEVLMAHHSSRRKLLDNITKLQLITQAKVEAQFQKIEQKFTRLKRHVDTHELWGKLLIESHDQINHEVLAFLSDLTEATKRRSMELKFDNTHEPEKVTQDILRNLGCFDVCMQIMLLILTIDQNATHSVSNKNTRRLVAAGANLLYWFTLDNPTNQSLAYTKLEFFIKVIDERVGSDKVIRAIFSNNDFLMKSIPKQYINDMVGLICNNGRFPQYLSLLLSVTAAGLMNIIENQYEVIRAISSPGNQKKITQYFCPLNHPDYSKKVKLMMAFKSKKDVEMDDLPSDLAYHLDLMEVLSKCTIGRSGMTTIEAKVQSMFFFIDALQAMLDPNCILIAKIRLGLFVYNAMIETEMKIPTLKDAQVIWDLIETFTDVFAAAKDELRQIEKNGWEAATSHRQLLEYMIVITQITHGFFFYYYDSSMFRPDVGQTRGIVRIQMKESRANEIMRGLFVVIQSIYNVQSPLLSQDHYVILFNTLCALNTAGIVPFVSSVEDIHSSSSFLVDNDHHNKSNKKFDQFLSTIKVDNDTKESIENEVQHFISKLENLPFKDEGADSLLRLDPILTNLIDHITGTVEIVVHGDEVTKHVDENCTKTAIWLIRMFRTMIENKWGMTIAERDDDGGEEEDESASQIMDALNNCGATEMCLDLIARGIQTPLQVEAIKLLVALLFKEGGAHDVQVSIHNHLNKGNSDLFFRHIKSMLQSLFSWHRWNGVVLLEDDAEPDMPEEFILVRCLQLMCEGHFEPNQDIMRAQPNNRVAQYNLLDDFVQYMQCLDTIKCNTSTTAALAVSATILEVIQGPCIANQDHFALNTELIETLNRLMRHRPTNDCDPEAELELKKGGIEIFQALLEGQGKKTAVFERMLSVIHLDVIHILSETPPEDSDPVDGSDSDMAGELRTECLVLLEMLFDFKPSLRATMGISEDLSAMSEVGVACIEAVWNGELQRRFFSIPEICEDLAKSTKDTFILEVDRSSSENKLFALLDGAQDMYREILHQQVLKEYGVARIFSRTNQDISTRMTFVLALVINTLFTIFYKTDFVPCGIDTSGYEEVYPDQICSALKLDATVEQVIFVIQILNIVSASFTLLLFLVVRVPVNFQTHQESNIGLFQSILYTAFDPMTLYYFTYIMIAVIAIKEYYIASFLLLDIIILNDTIRGVLNAVYFPRKQIAMTMILTWITVYIYSMLYFLMYNNDEVYDNQQNFITLVNTLKWFIRYASESGSVNDYEDVTFTTGTMRYVVETSFFMVMLIMWSIIQGITIDTFVELRLNMLERIRDTEEVCFICGIDQIVFVRAIDRDAFENHVKYDQNLWNYVFFIIHLWEQDKDDDDGLEYYVRGLLDNVDLSWFPLNKAIRLVEHHDKSQEESLPNLFNKDLVEMESTFDKRLGVFKGQLSRSIARVEHALSGEDAGGDDGGADLLKGLALNGTEEEVNNEYDQRKLIPVELADGDEREIAISLARISGIRLTAMELTKKIACRITSHVGTYIVYPKPFEPKKSILISSKDKKFNQEKAAADETGNVVVGKYSVVLEDGTVDFFFDESDSGKIISHKGPLFDNVPKYVSIQVIIGYSKELDGEYVYDEFGTVGVGQKFLAGVSVSMSSLVTSAQKGSDMRLRVGYWEQMHVNFTQTIIRPLAGEAPTSACKLSLISTCSDAYIKEKNDKVKQNLREEQAIEDVGLLILQPIIDDIIEDTYEDIKILWDTTDNQTISNAKAPGEISIQAEYREDDDFDNNKGDNNDIVFKGNSNVSDLDEDEEGDFKNDVNFDIEVSGDNEDEYEEEEEDGSGWKEDECDEEAFGQEFSDDF